MSTIVPVPKKAKLTELNRPAALTSVIMKYFEKQVKDHITSTLPDTVDPLQFAYRPNRSTDDAIDLFIGCATCPRPAVFNSLETAGAVEIL
jgi:hypothetical protein